MTRIFSMHVQTNLRFVTTGDEQVCVMKSRKDVNWVTSQELRILKMTYDIHGKFYVMCGSSNAPTIIRTLAEEHRTGKPYADAVNEFEHSVDIVRPMTGMPFTCFNDLMPSEMQMAEMTPAQIKMEEMQARSCCLTMSHFAFDALEHKRLAKFVRAATHWPIASKLSLADINHTRITKQVWYIDMNNAYTQHSAVPASLYCGFLGKITQFAKCSNDVWESSSNVGIFHVVAFDDSDVSDRHKTLFRRWPLFVDDNSYTTPLLRYAESIGFTFEIDYGCWGLPYTFEFPSYMYKKDTDMFPDGSGPRHYAKYTGCASRRLDADARVTMHGDAKMFALMAEQVRTKGAGKVRMLVNKVDNMATIEYKRESLITNPHLSAFVTSYMVINLLLQIDEIACIDDVFAIFCDAIVVSKKMYHNLGDIPLRTRCNHQGDAFCGPSQKMLWKVEERPWDFVINTEIATNVPLVSNIVTQSSIFASSKALDKMRKDVHAVQRRDEIAGVNQHLMPLDRLHEIDLMSISDHDLQQFMVYDDLGENKLSKQDTISLLVSLQDSLLDRQMENSEQRRIVAEALVPVEPPVLNENVDDANDVFGSHCVALLGPGGSGKTTCVTSNPRFVDVGFASLMYCLGSDLRRRRDDPNDKMVTNLHTVEVLGMLARTPRGAERRAAFLKRHAVLIIDETSMITMDDICYIHEIFAGKVMIILAGDIGYQTPPIQFKNTPPSNGMVSNPHNEASEMSLLHLGYRLTTFFRSYRQLPSDPLLDILHDIRHDIREQLHDVSDFAEYRRVSLKLATNYCIRLLDLEDAFVTLREVIETMSINDMVLTYTNASKDDITDMVKKQRTFIDDKSGERVRKWYVRTNNYQASLGLCNGTIVVSPECPVKFRSPGIVEHADEQQVASRKKRKRSINSDNPEKRHKVTKNGARRVCINGHSKRIEPIVERYCFTVHSVQGHTIETPRKLFVDLYKMEDIRVLYTALSRLQSINQLRVFENVHAKEIDDSDGLVGYIYMLTSNDPHNKNFYIGHTFSNSVQGRVTTHATQYNKFMNNYQGTSILVGDELIKFSFPPPPEINGRLKGWCSSFLVLHPDPKNIDVVELERVVYDSELSEQEVRKRIEGLENEYINQYRNNQSVNVHGVDCA